MNLLQVLQKSDLDSVVAVSVPFSSDLMMLDIDYFPPYFRGWCASSNVNVQVSEVDDALPPDLFDEPCAAATVPRAMFAIENCTLETAQRFCQDYEALHSIGLGSEHELVVLQITRAPEDNGLKQGSVPTAQPVSPELPIAHQTNEQASTLPTPSRSGMASPLRPS